MSFYPENVEIKGGEGRYMKFTQGDNRFRILSEPVIGFEWWVDKTPKRVPAIVKDGMFQPVKPIPAAEVSEKQPARLFNAFVVWNYQTERIEILEITQKSVLRLIMKHSRDEDYGDPRKYDIVVSRDGEGLDTSYEFMAKPPKEPMSEVLEAYEKENINLKALFTGKDPFNFDQTEADVKETLQSEQVSDIPF